MSEPQAPRKIHKGRQRLIGGVCSGLGDFFGVDPWVVRIVFIVLTVAPAGIGLLLYLVLWLLMPNEPRAEAGLTDAFKEGARSMAGDVRRIAGDLGIGKRRAG